MPVPSYEIPAYPVSPEGRLMVDLPPLRTLAGLPATRTVKLGRIAPPAGRPTIRLSNYLSRLAAVPPPKSIDYATKAMASIRLVYGNDQEGDCVIASSDHGVGVWSGNDENKPIVGTTAEALSDYHAWCGPGDNGCVIVNVLNKFQSIGVRLGGQRYKIDGWAAFDPTNPDEVKTVLIVFGGGRIGFNVPREWMDNAYEGAVWDTPSRYSFIGGHDVRLIDYNETGVRVATWGLIVTITWRALADTRIVDEAYIELSPNWYGNDKMAPNGIDAARLASDLALVRAGQLPDWQPDEPPPPAGPYLKAEPASGVVPLSVEFNSNLLYGADGKWEFTSGDGYTAKISALPFTYTYANPGTYIASLNIPDGGVSTTVEVKPYVPPPPIPGPPWAVTGTAEGVITIPAGLFGNRTIQVPVKIPVTGRAVPENTFHSPHCLEEVSMSCSLDQGSMVPACSVDTVGAVIQSPMVTLAHGGRPVGAVPWLLIAQMVAKVVPIVIAGVQAGKPWNEIVADVLAALASERANGRYGKLTPEQWAAIIQLVLTIISAFA